MYGAGFPHNWMSTPHPTPERKLVIESTLVFCPKCGCHYLDICPTHYDYVPVKVGKK